MVNSSAMILERIRQRAAADLQHIILPEGDDPRTVEAAAICARDKVAKITVLGSEEKLRELAGQTGANLNGVDILATQALFDSDDELASIGSSAQANLRENRFIDRQNFDLLRRFDIDHWAGLARVNYAIDANRASNQFGKLGEDLIRNPYRQNLIGIGRSEVDITTVART